MSDAPVASAPNCWIALGLGSCDLDTRADGAQHVSEVAPSLIGFGGISELALEWQTWRASSCMLRAFSTGKFGFSRG